MTREVITRSDGETVDVVAEEANQADLSASAKRVILVDSSGNSISTSNPLPVDTEISLNGDLIVENVTVASLRGALRSSSVTVGTSPTAIPATALENRKSMTVKNNGSSTIYLGHSDVSASNGYPLKANESLDVDLDDATTLYGVVESGSEDLRVLEFS